MRSFYPGGLTKMMDGNLDLDDPSSDVRCLLLRDTGSYVFSKSHVNVADLFSNGAIEISVASYARKTLAGFATAEDVDGKAVYTSVSQIDFGVLESGQSVVAAVFFLFVTNDADSELLWYDDGKIQVIANAPMAATLSGTVLGVTKANPGVITFNSGHNLSNGDEVYLASLGGMVELNGRKFTLANNIGDTFELSGEDTTSHNTYTSGGVWQQCVDVYVDRLKDTIPAGTSILFSGGESITTVGSTAKESRVISARNITGSVAVGENADDVATLVSFPIALSDGNFAINGTRLVAITWDRS